jgi:hypothetical protein
MAPAAAEPEAEAEAVAAAAAVAAEAAVAAVHSQRMGVDSSSFHPDSKR